MIRKILIILGIGFILFTLALVAASKTVSEDETNPTPTPEKEFRVSIEFTGTQFAILNLDDHECTNALLAVDGKYNLDGYTLGVGEIYKVGAAQFADSDGNRFNPFTQKPQSFSVICQGNNELESVSFTGMF